MEWDSDTVPAITSIPAISSLYPRVRFGTVWGCVGMFIAYGVYAAGIEELSSQEFFDTPDKVSRLLEHAYAVVDGHLNHAVSRIVA